jgi:transposase-like protein
VAETFLQGSSVNGVARCDEINPNVLFSWRKRFRSSGLRRSRITRALRRSALDREAEARSLWLSL